MDAEDAEIHLLVKQVMEDWAFSGGLWLPWSLRSAREISKSNLHDSWHMHKNKLKGVNKEI